jgi:adenine specific DNA methylase Mod
MIGNVSIDLSLKNIWQSYFQFRAGKNKTRESDNFAYYLEKNLYDLFIDLNNRNYKHGGYRHFTVSDNKKRRISVANLRDRIVHRLVYEYLVKIYNETFFLMSGLTESARACWER